MFQDFLSYPLKMAFRSNIDSDLWNRNSAITVLTFRCCGSFASVREWVRVRLPHISLWPSFTGHNRGDGAQPRTEGYWPTTGTILQSRHWDDETTSYHWWAYSQPIPLALSWPPLYYSPWTLWNVVATLSWYHGVSWLARHRLVLERPSKYCQQNTAWHYVWRQIIVYNR